MLTGTSRLLLSSTLGRLVNRHRPVSLVERSTTSYRSGGLEVNAKTRQDAQALRVGQFELFIAIGLGLAAWLLSGAVLCLALFGEG